MHSQYSIICHYRVHVCMVPEYLAHACPSSFRLGEAGACMYAPAGNKSKTTSFPVKPAGPGTRVSALCGVTAESHFRDNSRLNNNVLILNPRT